MSKLRGAVTLVVCLVLAGLIRMSIPDDIPRIREVRPDASGAVTCDDFTARLEQVRVGTVLERDDGKRLASEYALVVARVAVEPRGQTMRPSAALRTSDGHVYTAASDHTVPTVGVVSVGFRGHLTLVFQLPPEQLGEVTLLMTDTTFDPLQSVDNAGAWDLDLEPADGTVKAPELLLEVA